MKNKKNVTAKTIVANRNNAKSSTGPHTQRGKDFAKFNALKYGLFAEEDVIPLCDGDEAAIKYQRFVRDLCKDFRPYGVFQTAQLDIMAKNLWRLRRGTRAEYG